MSTVTRRRVHVTGVVQGVGFRPHTFRIATGLGLCGFVRNETTGVVIEVEGPTKSLGRFEDRLCAELPPMARIDTFETAEVPCLHERGFTISSSDARPADEPMALIPADRAVCDDCLSELLDPTDRRYRYPFITCTNCGPRFSMITRLPYDRPNTTMAAFELCPACDSEYRDPADRRYHAQPLACSHCGPHLWHERAGVVSSVGDAALARTQQDLAYGQVVAVKGLGGYHLATDAFNDEAVQLLRSRKHRPDKPFAVMVPDIATARTLAHISPAESAALQSPARPIVLLANKPSLSTAVVSGSPFIGLMLAYTPLHHLLFRPVPGRRTPVPRALVMTSGNVAGEPICFDDHEARTRLAGLADSFCAHNRPIQLPCDDSVVRLIDNIELPIRRSRGHVPLAIRLPVEVAPTLALGGDIKNTFCIASGRNAWLSQHLGDMENLESLTAFESSIDSFCELHRVDPEVIAVDAHPRYRTRRWGRDRAKGQSLVEVQHHHAHLAAVMAENGLDGNDPVLGFVFDGTGYGPDGALWGGEVLIADYDTCERWGHLAEAELPGGDAAIRNPCRMALSHLANAGITWTDEISSVRACEKIEREVLTQQLQQVRDGVTTTSMGRLFDAVASLLDVRHRISYEAQAAIELEVLATQATEPVAPLRFEITEAGVIDPAPLVRSLVASLGAGADRAGLALAFHDAVVEAVATIAQTVRRDRSIDVVGLSGGVFQNVRLASATTTRLSDLGFQVVTHRLVPPNDGGIALGQAIIAASSVRQCAESGG